MSDQTFQPATRRPVTAGSFRHLSDAIVILLPGVAVCGILSAAAYCMQIMETRLFGRAWLEPLVLAILLGMILRTLWRPSPTFRAGVTFSSKQLLEVAVMLLGASVKFGTLTSVGPSLLIGIVAVVATAVPTSFVIGRMLGLPRRMAMLVACGNSICGNSAIAAVAPTIGADCDDVAASVAFTAVLGVAVVLCLPFLAMALRLDSIQFGALSGLLVYSTPQVLAAAASGGPVAVQVGTLVKLVRVLMLGPVALTLSVLSQRLHDADERSMLKATRPTALRRMVPWFIVAFLALATLRSFDLIPVAALTPAATLADVLTILSMAALGLGVDIRVMARAGTRVTAAVTLSLAALAGVSIGLIHVLGL